jgi:3-deoxy-D-manno-octulosonic-acid transferase
MPLAGPLSEMFDADIVLSVFSPSGYHFHRGNPHFSRVFCLPVDLNANAREAVRKIDPLFAVFIRNELWKNYIKELDSRNTPVFLVNAPNHVLNPSFPLLLPHTRRLLAKFTAVFAIREPASHLAGNTPIIACGDTKWDAAAMGNAGADEVIRSFAGNSLVIVGGSIWKKETSLLAAWWDRPGRRHSGADIKLILAPHVLSKENISRLKALFPDHCLYSSYADADREKRVMILDRYRILAGCYSVADIAVIGGGFGKGIHNITEAAVHGVPTVFGPRCRKFDEARELVAKEGAFRVRNHREFSGIMDMLAFNEDKRHEIRGRIFELVSRHKGVSGRIAEDIRRFIPRGISDR